MASVYRRTRSYPIPTGAEIVTARKGQRFAKWTDGKRRPHKEPLSDDGDAIIVEAGNYSIAYWDANGERQEVNSGTTDKDAAQQLANHLETEAMKRRTGQIDGKLERHGKEARRPIAEQLADFHDYLQAKGNGADHGPVNGLSLGTRYGLSGK